MICCSLTLRSFSISTNTFSTSTIQVLLYVSCRVSLIYSNVIQAHGYPHQRVDDSGSVWWWYRVGINGDSWLKAAVSSIDSQQPICKVSIRFGFKGRTLNPYECHIAQWYQFEIKCLIKSKTFFVFLFLFLNKFEIKISLQMYMYDINTRW